MGLRIARGTAPGSKGKPTLLASARTYCMAGKDRAPQSFPGHTSAAWVRAVLRSRHLAMWVPHATASCLPDPWLQDRRARLWWSLGPHLFAVLSQHPPLPPSPVPLPISLNCLSELFARAQRLIESRSCVPRSCQSDLPTWACACSGQFSSLTPTLCLLSPCCLLNRHTEAPGQREATCLGVPRGLCKIRSRLSPG